LKVIDVAISSLNYLILRRTLKLFCSSNAPDRVVEKCINTTMSEALVNTRQGKVNYSLPRKAKLIKIKEG
jgi:hypothetical protein